MDGSERRILVTGATGTVGSLLVDALADTTEIVRATVRDPESADLPEDVETVAFDFERPETWGRAFEDVDAMFLLRPPAISRVHESITPAIDAARRMGVDHVVLLSVLGAQRNPLLPHRRIERHLEQSGPAWTFLRASFFMENLLEVHGAEIRDRGEIVVPAGDGTTSFVAAADVAAVAARVLFEPGHRGVAYDLTGPEALSYHEVATVIGEVVGREIDYDAPSLVRFVRHSRRTGRPWAYVAVMAALYTTARLGLAGRVTDDTARLLDRTPRSLREWVRANRSAFTPTKS